MTEEKIQQADCVHLAAPRTGVPSAVCEETLRPVAGAAPTEQERPLSWEIESVEQVAAMETAELQRLLVLHESELIHIVGRLEANRGDRRWAPRARQAERVLRLHKSWIDRELRQRQQEGAVRAKQAKVEAHHAAKMARISASNNENMRQLAIFKAVAREELGAEKYLHLWNLVRQRISSDGAPTGQSRTSEAGEATCASNEPDEQDTSLPLPQPTGEQE